MVSTANANLQVRFTIDYPCGWHVFEQPLQSFADETSERKGRMLDQLLLSALPISYAPSEGPPTEISVDSWYDDTSLEGDALPSLADWIANAKKRFSNLKETTVKTRDGLTVTRIAGATPLSDEPVPAVLYVWEWTDRSEVRYISEAFAVRPGPIVTRTIAALVRSFRVIGS